MKVLSNIAYTISALTAILAMLGLIDIAVKVAIVDAIVIAINGCSGN